MKRFGIVLVLAASALVPSCAGPAATRAQDAPAPAPVPAARQDFLKLIDRPRVPLAAEIQQTGAGNAANGLVQYHFTFAAETGQRVPGILLKSANAGSARRPAVIAMHGTGGSKNDELPLMRQLANRGFIAVAIDGRYHGERAAAAPKEGNLNAYETAIARAWREAGGSNAYEASILNQYQTRHEHPLFFDTVWDIQRLIDYLDTRDDVDPDRIGLYGVSKGGIETYLAAAVDVRVAIAVPCIAVQSFHYGVENNAWKGRIATFQKAFNVVAKESNVTTPDAVFVKQFYDRVIPGIDAEFDGPKILALIAPRPLLIVNSDNDANTPFPGVQEAAAATLAAYKAGQAEDRFAQRVQPNAGHAVTRDSERATIEWFVQWLKPEALVPATQR